MKGKIIAAAILTILFLSACQTQDSSTTLPTETQTPANVAEETNTPTDETTAEDGVTDEDDPQDEELDNDEEITEDDENSREIVETLMSNSDYISKVKLSNLSDGSQELRFMENYKGNLETIEFTTPENLEENREYLIFYKDDENGDIVPTNGRQSYIQVADTNDAILEYVESIYVVEEPVEEEEDNSNNSNTDNRS